MSANDDGFLRAWHRCVPQSFNPLVPMPKLVGGAPLTTITTGNWSKINDVPSAYYAQLTGTSGAVTATCHFEFGDDINNAAGQSIGVAPAGVGTTITLTGTGTGVGSQTVPSPSALVGTGMFGADASVSPLVPWKYCRLVVTAISGTGAQVAGFQNLGGL